MVANQEMSILAQAGLNLLGAIISARPSVKRSDKTNTRLAISLLKKSYLVIYPISKDNGAS